MGKLALDYAKAAEILASCPKYKLKAVVELLQKGGYEIDYGTVVRERGEDKRKTWEYLKRKHEGGKRDGWNPTTNETILKIREAHEAGVNFTELSEMARINRVTLYRYLWGKHTPPEQYAEAIISAIDEIYERDAIPAKPFWDE